MKHKLLFFPRWRVLFVFHWGIRGPQLEYGRWWPTQEQAERHAIRFLNGDLVSGERVPSEFYDFERQG